MTVAKLWGGDRVRPPPVFCKRCDLKEIKLRGINGCGSVDSEWVGRELFLLSGNLGGAEDFC